MIEKLIDKYLVEEQLGYHEELFKKERNPKPGQGWKVTRTWYLAEAKNAGDAIIKTKKMAHDAVVATKWS